MTQAIAREVEEETGLKLNTRDIILDSSNEAFLIHSPLRESRAYYGICSEVSTQLFAVELPVRPLDRKGRPWRNLTVFQDGEVVIAVKAFPILRSWE